MVPTLVRYAVLTNLLFLAACTSASTARPASISPASGPPQGGRTVLIVADNQERQLTGVPLNAMSWRTERYVTSVALRSPLANVGGRLLLRETLRFGREQGAGLVLHLGDAADISCPDELSAVFDALEEEAAGIWFIAPGNHDGMMAGTYVRFQPSTNFDIRAHPPIYRQPPTQAFRADRGWLNACLSPANATNPDRADILTKGDAVEMYANRLKARPGATTRRLDPETVRIANTTVVCQVEEIQITAMGYSATTRVCPRTPVASDTTRWVGPYASYIVQKLDVEGTRIILLDTSHYRNPSVINVGLSGELGEAQRLRAQRYFDGVPKASVIIAGHHPLEDLGGGERRWISERAERYMSAHVHRSASLIEHTISGRRLVELNIGSTLDYPSQAIIANLGSAGTTFRVAGASPETTRWPSFIQPCVTNRESWRLADAVYKDYTDGLYAARVIAALQQAAARAPGGPAPAIPDGSKTEHWAQLDDALRAVQGSQGEAREYWACQAYYASEATRHERGLFEKLSNALGLGSKAGADATGDWFDFSGG